MVSIVFVCTGNICRSPMAEGILKELWKKNGTDELRVSSMGTHGLDNQQANAFARQACMENGIDIDSHRSRSLMYEELDGAALIFTMEKVQKEFVRVFFPRLAERVCLLGAWPGEKENRKAEIADPMGGSLRAFRQSFIVIHRHIERVIPEIREYYF